MNSTFPRTILMCTLTAFIGVCFTLNAAAQGAVSRLIEEVVVTATKKADAETLQGVPFALTAYGSGQLDALKVRDLKSLSVAMPNVSLEDIGTTRGTANFSIRGLGINSSIPSIDPTVGVFVDGVYLGVTAGVVLDIFDLEAVEVLRGPQGLLFGRNVTGGAVVLRTKKPGDEFEVTGKAAFESGLQGTGNNHYVMGSVSGPISDQLGAKVSAYWNGDNGWHQNLFDGSDHGEADTFMIRPSVVWTPHDDLEFIFRYEHGESDGDGPAAQNRLLHDRNSFDFAIDEPGLYDNEWDQFTFEANWDVPFGDGTITNIFGWRDISQRTVADIDGFVGPGIIPAPLPFLFHATTVSNQDQISNELRFAGRFAERMDLTVGFYYFTQDLFYQENRFVPVSVLDFSGGGTQDHETWGIFAQADIDITDTLALTLGGRYTEEKKRVEVASLLLNIVPSGFMVLDPAVAPGCAGQLFSNCIFDFSDRDKWDSFTPKVGLQWVPNDNLQLYGFWTRGFRSGGYNLRNTSPTTPPGPFDQESQHSFEVGAKTSPLDGRARFNIAFYRNEIDNMQREINLPDPVAGVVQIIQNTAEATIQGFEVEGQILVTENLLVQGSVGHTDGDYDRILFDLTGDGMITNTDLDLKLPRLAPWTYSIGATYDHELGAMGYLTSRINYAHRDVAAYTDNNVGVINSANVLDASLAWTTRNEQVTFSVYGRNLLDEAWAGGDTQLPFGSFSPLNKGLVTGIEVQLNFWGAR